MSLMLPGKRLAFTSLLPAFSATVPPSSIRDDLRTSSSSSPAAKSKPQLNQQQYRASLKGFGSDTKFNSPSSSNGSNGKGGPVVLVPTHYASDAASGGMDRGRGSPGVGERRRGERLSTRGQPVDLENFYSSSDEDEDEDDEEEDRESDEEDEEDEEQEDEEDEDEEEELSEEDQEAGETSGGEGRETKGVEN